MNTTFIYRLNVVATNIQDGNFLAGAIGVSKTDGETFTESSLKCYSPGTTFTIQSGIVKTYSTTSPVAAYAVGVAVEQYVYNYATQFNTIGVYPDVLLRAGLSTDEINRLKSTVKIQAGLRTAIENDLLGFISSLNYVPAPMW